MTVASHVEVAPGWGQNESVWQPRRAAFWLLVVLTALGVLSKLSWISVGFDSSPEGASLAFGLWVAYAAVFVLVIARFDLLEPEPLTMLGAGFLWGAFVAAEVAGLANASLDKIVYSVAGARFTLEWGAAVEAPLTEETLKALGVVVLVLIARRQFNNLVDGLVYGALVGLGFQVAENFFYTVAALATPGVTRNGDPLEIVLQVFFLRGFGGGLWSHAAWTAMVGLGIAYFVTCKDRTLARRLAVVVGLFLVACAFHFSWNSPLLWDAFGGSNIPEMLPVSIIIKGLPALALLGTLYWFARRREVAWFDDALRTEAALVPPDELATLHTLHRRRAACNLERRRHGTRAARIRKKLQRAQARLAVEIARFGDTGAPGVAIARADVQATRAALDAATAATPSSVETNIPAEQSEAPPPAPRG